MQLYFHGEVNFRQGSFVPALETLSSPANGFVWVRWASASSTNNWAKEETREGMIVEKIIVIL